MPPLGVKPILKWAGGKSWFVKEYGDDLFTQIKGRYIEPFLGGAAMALHLGVDGMLLGEIDPDVARMYVAVRDCPDEVISALEELAEVGTDKETYYSVRSLEPADSIEAAGRLIYLNRLGFNGLHRKNKKGEFNVPYGDGKGKLPAADLILEVSKALQDCDIFAEDFSELIGRAEEGDFIYADPPYDGTFSDYSSDGFSERDQIRLSSMLRAAYKRGVDIFAHNSDTPTVRGLYGSWADIIEMPESRTINSDGGGRGKVPCVLIAAVS